MRLPVRPLLSLLPLLLLPAACSRAPSDLRVWKPSDHDRAEENSNAQAAAAGTGSPDLSQPAKMLGVDQVVLVAWRQNCTRCHGMLGQGDGPQGAMYGARNLSDPAWQTLVTDADLATAIKQGKGKMPAFDLPDPTIKGLVHLVRMMNADRGSAPPAADEAGAPATGGGATKPAASGKRAHPAPRKAPAQRKPQ